MNIHNPCDERSTPPVQWKMAFATALFVVLCPRAGLAQVAPPSILQIDLANQVLYVDDVSDVTKFGTEPGPVAGRIPLNYGRLSYIADIVAVNGQRAMGSYSGAVATTFFRTAPTPGQAVADTVRNASVHAIFEILRGDGTLLGTITASGYAGGSPAPGSPLAAAGNILAITGGTGAFLGVRGQMAVAATPAGASVQRFASFAEDPANRRRNGGGTQRWIAQLIPVSAPQVSVTASGPSVFHADFSPVTAANPARPGEVLIVEASGLGPTVPGVEPGQPFPNDANLPVNSPLAVTVNGRDAEVINGFGWPGQVDIYRVDFRVPPGTTSGMATMQLSSAWIVGPPVRIAVQ